MHLNEMTKGKIKAAIKGLKLLRKVVKKSDIEHYQNDWGVHVAKHKPDKKNYCGTMCCAAGKFALSKEGQKLGVEHEWVREDVYDPIKHRDRRGWALTIGGSQSLGEISEHIGEAINVPSRDLCDIFNSTGDSHAMGEKGILVVVDRINKQIEIYRERLKELSGCAG